MKTIEVHNDKGLAVNIGQIKEMIEHKKSLWSGLFPSKKHLADAITKRGASTDLRISPLRIKI